MNRGRRTESRVLFGYFLHDAKSDKPFSLQRTSRFYKPRFSAQNYNFARTKLNPLPLRGSVPAGTARVPCREPQHTKKPTFRWTQITDKPTIFRWVFVIHVKFLIFVDKKCKSLLQRIFAIFFMFCTAAVSKHCSETLSFPRIRQ